MYLDTNVRRLFVVIKMDDLAEVLWKTFTYRGSGKMFA